MTQERTEKQPLKNTLLILFFIAAVILGGKGLSENFFRMAHSVSLMTPAEEPPILYHTDIETDPQTFHTAAVNYKKQPDAGLSLYRSGESKQDVVWFYTHITGNADIAGLILEYANRNDISPSLAFALAWEESRYQVKAVNNNGTSIDRGLFQLNSRSFPELTESDFFDPETNIKYAMQHLSFCLQTAGNEVAALAMYNAGTNKVRSNNTPQKTLNYVPRILSYRSGLEDLFAAEIAVRYRLDKTGAITLASAN